MFLKSFRIPFASRCRKKITAINMNCRRDLLQWVRDRMYHCFTEGNNVFGIDGFASQLDKSIFAPALKGIIFSSSVDPYHRPHPMIVGEPIHARPPQNIEDR